MTTIPLFSYSTPAPKPALTPSHYVTGFEGGAAALSSLIDLAMDIKARPAAYQRAAPLSGKVLTALFLNPSLRTRTSFDSAMARLGGHMIALSPGQGAWGMEFDTGVVMNGAAAEHIKEAAGVLSAYSDAIGIRAFGAMESFAMDMADDKIAALADNATVPVINLESAVHHPCQALADALTLHELFDGNPQGRKFTLTWATHPKMCGVAVPHSALLTAARLGMHVSVAHPEGYELHQPVLQQASQLAISQGGSLSVGHDMADACKGSDVIYAKAWGSPLDYGDPAAGAARNAQFSNWTVGAEHMALGDDPAFMHCLPVRRNVVVTDAVLDSRASVVQQQAENRMWAQMALLLDTLAGSH